MKAINLSDFGVEDTLLSGSGKEQDQRGAATNKGSAEEDEVDKVERVDPTTCTSGTAPMWRQKAPQYLLQQERYEHRVIAFLKAEGRTNREIAEMTGFTGTCINYVVKQPWCDKLIREIVSERGGANVIAFLERKAMKAAETMVDALDCSSEEAPGKRVEVAAANKILDRIFGKPNQPITNHRGEDVKKLTDAELEALIKPTHSTATSV